MPLVALTCWDVLLAKCWDVLLAKCWDVEFSERMCEVRYEVVAVHAALLQVHAARFTRRPAGACFTAELHARQHTSSRRSASVLRPACKHPFADPLDAGI